MENGYNKSYLKEQHSIPQDYMRRQLRFFSTCSNISVLPTGNHALCAYRNSHVLKQLLKKTSSGVDNRLGLANNSSDFQYSLSAQTTCFEHQSLVTQREVFVFPCLSSPLTNANPKNVQNKPKNVQLNKYTTFWFVNYNCVDKFIYSVFKNQCFIVDLKN